VTALNLVERVIRRVDQAQQRHTPPAFAFGIVKKFGDDNGGVLVGNLAHAGLVAVFPLLLVLVTVVGLIAANDPAVRQDVANAAAQQFPLIGHQLTGNVHALRRSSVIGLVIGLLSLIWGASGLAQAGLFTMAQVWNLPGPARPGYVQRLGRAALFLGVLALGVIITTLLTSLGTIGPRAAVAAIGVDLLAALANVGMYLAGFRVLTPRGVPVRQLVPGAIAGGLGWTLLQALGAYLVHHYLRSDSVYGIFATVLGLVAWIYLGVEITVYAAEVNVVLARRLWPRAIVQPPLTEADRASMALQALQNQRREEQHVNVSFDDRPAGAAAAGARPVPPMRSLRPRPAQSRRGPASRGRASR